MVSKLPSDLRTLTIRDVLNNDLRIDSFGIDGENDFLASGNEPPEWPTPYGGHRRGALYVEGADRESLLVLDLFRRLKNPYAQRGHIIRKKHITQDAHHENDGSHNIAWKQLNDSVPPPFTIVSHDDVREGKYLPRFPIGIWEGKTIRSAEWALRYTDALAKRGRNPLCLWPVHCKIGTWGSNFYHPIQTLIDEWCETTMGWVDYITKGQFVWSEHYSAFECDVPDLTVKMTQFNADVVSDAMNADLIIWWGWAGSHCLRWTALDAVRNFGTDHNEMLAKSIFFDDACAPVADLPNPTGNPMIPKFSEWRRSFLDEVQNRGATVMKTTEFLVA